MYVHVWEGYSSDQLVIRQFGIQTYRRCIPQRNQPRRQPAHLMTITMNRARYCSRRIAGLLISNIVLNLFTLVLTMLIGYYSYQLLVALFLKVERKLTGKRRKRLFFQPEPPAPACMDKSISEILLAEGPTIYLYNGRV